MFSHNNTALIAMFNGLGVVVAYAMLSLSIWLAPVDLSTKGYWGIGVLLLTLSLVNFVKYKFDERVNADRISRIEEAKNEKLLEDYVSDSKAA